MNAIELFHAGGKSAGIFYCEKCRIIHRTKAEADRCCDWKCDTCGAPTKTYWTRCDICCAKAKEAKERERFEKAEKVQLKDYSGWLYSEEVSGYNDGYFDNYDSLFDYCADEEIVVPEYAWACDEDHFVHADIEDITERVCDNAYEDFEPDCLSGIDALKKAIEVFNEANKHHVSYTPNYKKAVLLK